MEHRVSSAGTRGRLSGDHPGRCDAIEFLATLGEVATEQVLAIGHSAGGHLAAWAAGRGKLAAGTPGSDPKVNIAAVIGLAGVLDLEAAARNKLGSGAAIALMDGTPAEHSERYALADPLSQIPITATVRCVHSRSDDRVPFAQSVTYVRAAQATAQDAELIEVDAYYFSIADPSAPTWPTILQALEEATAS